MILYNEKSMKDEDFYRTFSKIYTDISFNGKAPWLHESDIPVERGIAYNPKSGVVFKGINSLILEMKSAQKGYTDSRWLSQNELYDLGWQPKAGEYPTPIAYINKYAPQTDVNPVSGKAFGVNSPRQRYYFMYNVEQLRNCELSHDKDFFISKGITFEKIKNAIENIGTKDIREINAKLTEKTIRAVPEGMQNLAAGIVQYRLAQEFRIPYKPQIAKETLDTYKKMHISQNDLLRTAYQTEVVKDRAISRDETLEHDRTRTVQRAMKRDREEENNRGERD